jgi:hypothetical protein
MVAILARTRVAPFRVFANSVLVTVIGVTIRTFIFIDTLAFPIALVETGFTFARTLDANRVL